MMDANGDSMEAANWLDRNENSHEVAPKIPDFDNSSSIDSAANRIPHACAAPVDLLELEMAQSDTDQKICFDDSAACDSAAANSMGVEDLLLATAGCEAEDYDTALPLHAALNLQDTCEGDGDDDEPIMLDGVIPIEVKADGGFSEDEAAPCEFCSPRLEAGDQPWTKALEQQDQSWDADGVLTLDQLDDDALFHIVRFLESRTIRFALNLVCQRFYVLFNTESYYWKIRYATQVGTKCRCPTMRTPTKFNAADRCLTWDDGQRIWSNPDANTKHFLYSHNVLGVVDTVHLMNKGQLLLSGDRNRVLNVIDLAKYAGPETTDSETKDMLVHSDWASHDGWIWTMASVGNTVMTGCWDTHLRLFDVEAQCKIVADYQCTSSVLSLYAEENEIVASCSNRKIYFIDRRSGNMQYRLFHSKAVLCVTGNDKFIISGSEDKRISIYDRRAAKVFKVFKLESFPLCMSFSDDQLWFGDRAGTLHLHDGTGEDFRHIGSYNIGHTGKMMGVINTPGAVFTCAGDGTVKVLEPTRNPSVLTSQQCQKKDVAGIAYSHGVLACAGDDSIGLWLPKYWDRNTYLL